MNKTARLQLLRDYFPTAIFTGKSLLFISETSRVELTEHIHGGIGGSQSIVVVRVRLFNKNEQGEFEPGHYDDFELENISELAAEVEKYVQFAVGKNIRER